MTSKLIFNIDWKYAQELHIFLFQNYVNTGSFIIRIAYRNTSLITLCLIVLGLKITKLEETGSLHHLIKYDKKAKIYCL